MPNDSADATEAAWAYERLHVNALFQQWTNPVLAAAAVTEGSRVLDVACGTGVLARAAHGRVSVRGSVTGVDINPAMLSVAASVEPGVTWIEGEAGQLPFDDDSFDAVVCQFGLMFFPDPVRAIHEMLRCVSPDGRVAVAVWDALERCEAYSLSVDLLNRRAGPAAAEGLRAPFVMGHPGSLRDMFQEAGARTISISTLPGTAVFPSVRSMVEADLRGWLPIMGVCLEEAVIGSVLNEAENTLGEYVVSDKTMVFDVSAHIIVAQALPT